MSEENQNRKSHYQKVVIGKKRRKRINEDKSKTKGLGMLNIKVKK